MVASSAARQALALGLEEEDLLDPADDAAPDAAPAAAARLDTLREDLVLPQSRQFPLQYIEVTTPEGHTGY